ncbi:MAG: MG2 domain-containing protein [Kiritimatiellaeota bacterium]|nr:MG2 domain-containing protein [Kiritimatiellota bacterium]
MKKQVFVLVLLAVCAIVMAGQLARILQLRAMLKDARDARGGQPGSEDVQTSPEIPKPSEPPKPVGETTRQRSASEDRPRIRAVDLNAEQASGKKVFEIDFYGNAPSLESLREALTLEPAVDNVNINLEYSGWHTEFSVSGDFTPGGLYAFTFRKDPGLSTADGTRIPQSRDWVYTMKAGALQPSVRLDVAGRYFAPTGRLLLAAQSLAAREYTVEVARVPAHNIVAAARNEAVKYWDFNADWVKWMTTASTSVTYRVSGPLDTVRKEHASLLDFSGGGDARGVWLLGVRMDNEEGDDWSVRRRSRLVAVTDIGLSAALRDDAAEVCALSLSRALPIEGLAVELYAMNGTLLARGVTDENGTLALRFAKAVEDVEKPLVLVAAGEGDQSFLIFTEKNQTGTPFVSPRGHLREGGLEAFVFTDRGIYRPGETLLAQGLVRGRDGLPPKEKFPLFVTLLDPLGQKYKPETVTLDETGSFTLELTLPETGRQGRYEISVSHAPNNEKAMGSVSVSMESFVPPTVKVEAGELEVSDDTLTVPVKAEFLFGAPGRGLSASATLKAADLVFERDGFVFGNREAEAFFASPEKVAGLLLDDAGQCGAVFKRPDLPNRGALRLTVEVEVMEPGGRPAVEVRGYDYFACYDAYLGYAKIPGSLDANTPFALRSKIEGADDTSDWRWQYALKKIQHYWTIKENDKGWWTWHEERVEEIVKQERGLEAPPHELPPLPEGEYVLVVEKELGGGAPNACCGASLSWRVGALATMDRAKPEAIVITPEKPRYVSGETAVFHLAIPFEGAKSVWVMFQNNALVEQFVLPATGAVVRVEFPLTRAHAPGLTLLASAVHPARTANEWGAHRAMGVCSFAVVPDNSVLKVDIAAEENSTPSRDYPVAVAVRDERGAAVPNARVTVMLVEEGICRLTRHTTPDPLAFFFEPRQFFTRWFDVYRALIPLADEAAAVEASKIGGGGEGETLARRLNPVKARRFNPLARWKADLRTDADGNTVAVIPVHEVATGARVMVVAWTTNQYGNAETSVKFARDVTVLLDGPRFMAPGDEAEGTISLHNTTDAEQTVFIDCSTTNHPGVTGGLVLSGAPVHCTLKPRASENLFYTLAARDTGVARVSVRIRENQNDPGYTLSYELSVRPAAGLQTRTTYHTVAPGEKVELPALDGVMKEAARRVVSAHGNPVADLTGAMDYLSGYPYGCLEQTISTTFPLITWPDVLAAGPGVQAAAESRVRAGVTRALSLWRGGGFSPWPQYHEYAPRDALYPLEFFAAARAAGHVVPDGVFNGATGVVRDWTRTLPVTSPHLAYACYTLALAGSPDHGRMSQCRENLGALSLEDRVLVAGAFLEAGNAQAAREILAELPFPANDLRAAARSLMLHARLAPASPMGPRLAQLIKRNLRASGHWGTTSENALMTRALGAWFAAHKGPAGDFDLRVEAPGVDAASGATNQFTLALDQNLSALTLSNNGPAPAHVAVKNETIPTSGLPDEEDCGISIRRESDVKDGVVGRGGIATFTLTLDTRGAMANDLVVDIPLPAGLEPCGKPCVVENGGRQDIKDIAYQCEARDDRHLIFLKPVQGVITVEYAALAVSPGVFIHPPATVSAMYEPDVYSVSGGGKITVK